MIDSPLDNDSRPWYLVYSKPKQEHIAAINLEQQRFEVYLPMYKVFKKNKNTLEPMSMEPMFPRYVLFRPESASHSIATVRSTRGVNHLVRFGFEPAKLSERLVAIIREHETQRQQADFAEVFPFKAGNRVLVETGPLKGLLGVVQMVSSQRVAVLLELLGQDHCVDLEPQALCAA